MPGLVRGVARTAVVAGTATAVSNRVSRRQVERWSEEAPVQSAPPPVPPQQPQYQQAPPPPAPASSSTGDMLAELQTLGELHASGVLTDEEFAEQKAKILAS